MLPILLLLADTPAAGVGATAQVAVAPAPAAPGPAVPERFSILLPDCAHTGEKGDIIVCARGPNGDRLPLPDDAPPSTYVKPDSGDYRDNYRQVGTPCAAMLRGCTVGFGPPIVPMVQGAARLIGDARKDRRWAAARKRDGDRRIAIDLDGTSPVGQPAP